MDIYSVLLACAHNSSEFSEGNRSLRYVTRVPQYLIKFVFLDSEKERKNDKTCACVYELRVSAYIE